MKESEIRSVSKILIDLWVNIVKVSNLLTLCQAELDSDVMEDEELSENIEDFLNDLAAAEVSMVEFEYQFTQDLQQRLIDVIGDKDDGVYRD